MTTATAQRAVPQQIDDIKYLLGRLEARGKDLTGTRAKLNECWKTDQFTVEFAAGMIRTMLDLSEELDLALVADTTIPDQPAPARPDVPAGRYAVTTDDGHYAFYRVWRGSRGGVVVYMQISDDEQRMYGAQATAILCKIKTAGPLEAAKAYGREIGECGICGRTLTNEESRAAGIGPICSQKY